MAARIADWILRWQRRPRLLVLALAVFSVGAAIGLTRLELDPDVGALLPEDSPQVALFRATQLNEDYSRSLFVLVRGADLEQRLPQYLRQLRDSPYLSEVVATRAQLGGRVAEQAALAPLWFVPVGELDELQSRLTPEGIHEAVQETMELMASDPLMGVEVARADPLGLRWILDPASGTALPSGFTQDSEYLLLDSGQCAFVKLTGLESAFDTDFSEDLLADLEERSADFDLTVAGGYAIAREDSRRIRGDLGSSLNWSIPLLLIFFIFSSRSILVSQLYLIPTVVAIFWSIGYGGLVLGSLSPLAISAVAILCGLGVDFNIHYLGRFREERARSGFDEALRKSQRSTARSLIGCWLTSCVAFLSVAAGSFSGLRELGYLLALGLTLALLSTWTVLPLLLRYAPRLRRPSPPGAVVRGALWLKGTRLAGPVSVALLLLAGAGWLLVATRGVTFDADPRHLRSPDSEVASALTELERHLGFAPEGVTTLLGTEHSAGVLASAARELHKEGRVSFSDAALLVAQSVERRQRLEEFQRVTAGWVDTALGALTSAGFRAQEFSPGLEEFATRFAAQPTWSDPPPGRFPWQGQDYWTASFHAPMSLGSALERRTFREAIRQAVGVPCLLMDPGALGDAIGPLLSAELRSSLAVCSILVTLVILLSIGRVLPGLIAMTPVLCGLGVVLGLLALLQWPIHPGNFLALPLLIGLGVDDGLYMVNRHLEGASRPLETTGVAVWRTSAATSIGFGSLVVAQSPAIASLGAIVLTGSITCFITTVVLIPWLLRSQRNA